jgi:hypothetical protein
MRRFLSCLLPSFVALALGASAAPACINDREVETHEKEFKSQYLEFKSPYLQQPAQEPSYWPEVTPKAVAVSGAGIALLAGALAVGLKATGRR